VSIAVAVLKKRFPSRKKKPHPVRSVITSSLAMAIVTRSNGLPKNLSESLHASVWFPAADQREISFPKIKQMFLGSGFFCRRLLPAAATGTHHASQLCPLASIPTDCAS
jgi:hypothetical protein